MEWLDQIITLLVIVGLLLVYVKKKHSFWKEKGIPQPPTLPILGHFRLETSNQISQSAAMDAYYKKLKDPESPFIGLYFFTKPAVLLTDLDMIKTVFVKDFDHFIDHGHYYNEKDDPISATLFNVDEEKWRQLRSSLSPTFTGSKMKIMFPNVLDIADNNLVKAIDALVKSHPEGFDVKDLMSRFTTDVIGDCAFGLKCNSFDDPNNDFRRIGTLAFKRTLWRTLKIDLFTIFPRLARALRIKRIRPEVSDFYSTIVRKTVEYREKNGIVRNDFLNLLIGLKNDPKTEEDRLTMWQIAAQSFVFFTAGFETSSTTLTFLLYEISKQPEIQDKLREHINEVLEKNNGEFTYEALHELTYMEQVISETLRKYPVLQIIQRKVTKDYKVADREIVLKRGTMVLVPVYSIHNDPEIHPHPECFDPDRFAPERKMHPCSYLGFGFGSRNCIGSRFGMMQMKIGLVRLLSQFRFERTIDEPLQLDKSRPTVTAMGEVILRVTRLS